MIERDTIEGTISYCKSLIDSIKSRNTVEGSRLILVENMQLVPGSVTNVAVTAYNSFKIRVIFTPSSVGNTYAELGANVLVSNPALDTYLQVWVYPDPAYTSSSSIAWIVSVFNDSMESGTILVDCSVVSMTSGTILQELA